MDPTHFINVVFVGFRDLFIYSVLSPIHSLRPCPPLTLHIFIGPLLYSFTPPLALTQDMVFVKVRLLAASHARPSHMRYCMCSLYRIQPSVRRSHISFVHRVALGHLFTGSAWSENAIAHNSLSLPITHRPTAPPFHHSTQGCPVCKSLCCCNKGRGAVCTRKYHCYKKCVAPSGRSRREEADGVVVAPAAAAPAAPMGAGVVGGPPRGAIGGYDAIQGGIKRALAAKLFHQYTAGGGGQIAGAGPAGADAPAEEVVTVFNNRQNPLAIQPIAVQGDGQHVIAPDATEVAVPDDPDEYDENMHAFNAPTRVIAVAEEDEGIRPMFTISASSQHVRHRVSCHRCGNLRKNNVLCIRCPHIFCKRCADKMTAEHGRNVFEGGTFSVGVWARRVFAILAVGYLRS